MWRSQKRISQHLCAPVLNPNSRIGCVAPLNFETMHLPPELRDRYAEHLTRLVAPGGRILMVTFHYDPQRMSGPPFSLGGDEIEARFSERFEVRTLADDDWLQHEPHWANRGLDWLKVGTFLLTRRS